MNNFQLRHAIPFNCELSFETGMQIRRLNFMTLDVQQFDTFKSEVIESFTLQYETN